MDSWRIYIKRDPQPLKCRHIHVYVDAATVIEFGTRYNIVFKKKNLALLLSFIYRHWSHDMGAMK